MRKFYLVMVLAILIQACGGMSLGDGLFPSAHTPAPSATATTVFTPTITRTPTITPSITPSATIVRIPTEDPDLPTPTLLIIPTLSRNDSSTPSAFIPQTFTTKPGPGFLSLTISDNRIYWGVCEPNRTKITVEVEDPDGVFSVVIFVQVKSAKKEDYTPWTTGDAMHNHRDGAFSYLLRANSIYGRNHYQKSWVFLQMVATNDEGKEVGRTQVFRNLIALSPCM